MTAQAVAPVAPGVDSAQLSFGGVLRAELLKIRTLRSTWVMTGLALLIILVIGPLISLANGHTSTGSFDFDTLTQLSVGGIGLSQLIFGVFGVLCVTNEYATGLIRASLTATPRRLELFMAKTLVTGLFVLIPSVIACLIAFVLSQVINSTTPYVMHTPTLADPGVARTVIFAGVFLGLNTLLAHGFGWILRNTAGAIASLVGLLLVIPIVFTVVPSQFLHDILNWMPGQAMSDMLSTTTAGQVHGPWLALLIMCAYTAAALIAGAFLLQKRDA